MSSFAKRIFASRIVLSLIFHSSEEFRDGLDRLPIVSDFYFDELPMNAWIFEALLLNERCILKRGRGGGSSFGLSVASS